MRGRALLFFGLFAFAGIPGRAEGDVPWRWIRVPFECSQRGTASTCLLRFSRLETKDVVVEVPAGDQDVGYRLYRARSGAWSLEAEGVWHAAPESRRRIRAADSRSGGPARLELTGETGPPRLLGATVSVRDPVAVAAAGRARRPLPAPARGVLPLEDAWFPAAWPVAAEGAQPGDAVHLDLPGNVLRQLGRRELGGLRLATPQGSLPLELGIEDRPRREAEVAGARLVPAARPGWLRLSLPARPGPAYSEVHLTAPPRPLLRRVSVAGVEEVWSCVPTPPLPCRLVVTLQEDWLWPLRELPEIEVEGGEGRPLPPLEVSVWSRSETLIFSWPAQGPVRLLAGGSVHSQGIFPGADSYPGIPRRPWKRAVLGPEEHGPLVRRWTLGGAAFATLVLAGLCLKEWRWRRLVAALLLSLCAAQARGEDASGERSLDVQAGKPEGSLGDDFEAAAEWPVRTSGVAAGGVVRLELPAEVYVHGGSPNRLRLETAGRQIPYVLRALDLPAPVARGRLSPGQHSALSLTVSPALTLTGCRLETRERVDAWLRSEFESLGRWSCVPDSSASCVLEVEMPRLHSPGTLSLSASGEVSGEILVTLLRQRHELVFVWPAQGTVRLLAGPEGTAAPLYDLHAVQDRLLARPWQPVWLGRGQGHPEPEPAHGGLRKTLLGTAALVLLFAVHWSMPRRFALI